MSKLNQVIYPLLPNSQYVDSDEAKEVKENIKKLMLELVENTYTIYSDTLEGEALDKDELINRIEEL